MTYPVQCPDCPNQFLIHGFETEKTCYDCGRTFNPQEHGIHELREHPDETESET